VLSTLYASFVRRRRERYAARPDLRRRLRHPVVSVGNLAVGGRGKTPMVARLTQLLLEMGERPAILSRGYARERSADGVVIVRDRDGMRADLPRAGDEPLMLARQLPGASVVVSTDRYLAGRLAETHLGATVHVLDDGYQHLQLDRDIDLLLVAPEDLDAGATTLPHGHLREPADCLIAADAILTVESSREGWLAPYLTGELPPVFDVRRVVGEPRTDHGLLPPVPVFVVAGIASPERVAAAVQGSGWPIAGRRFFRDHHRYTARDLERIAGEARAAGAGALVTTEKDYVRLLPHRPFSMPVAWLPLTMEPEPLSEFREWLARSLREARDIWPGPDLALV
jgi:tetraacyldisaccharide 4'-kinase